MLRDKPPTVEDCHGDLSVRIAALPAEERAEMDRHFNYGAPDRTDAELNAMCEAEEARRPLPELKPITSRVQKLNPALWGDRLGAA